LEEKRSFVIKWLLTSVKELASIFKATSVHCVVLVYIYTKNSSQQFVLIVVFLMVVSFKYLYLGISQRNALPDTD